MRDHVVIALAVDVCDPRLHVHFGSLILRKVEDSRAALEVAVAAVACLAPVRQEDVVIAAREVVVAVAACADPADLVKVFGDGKHARVLRLAADRLLFVSCD